MEVKIVGRIALIKYRNIIGVEDLEISPVGKVTELTGKNGAGKSTTIDALFALIEGGSKATLTPKDGTVGEAVIVVDAAEDSYTFRRTFRDDGPGPLTVKSSDGTALPKPQDVMKKLINGMGANPVKFLNGTEEEQLEWVLKAVPLKVTAAQINAAIGSDYHWPVDGHALTVIDGIYDAIYKTRTGVNTSHKDATKDVERLRAGLLPDDGTDYSAEATRLQAELDATRAEWHRRKAAIATAKTESLATVAAQSAQIKGALQIEMEAKIQKLREEYGQKLSSVDIQSAGILANVDAEASAAAAEMEADLKPKAEKVSAELATAKARAEEYIRSKTTRQHFEDKKKDAEQYAAESTKLTNQLIGLDDLRKSLLTSFPIKGMEFPNGTIVYKGVPLRSMSSGEQIKLGIQVAALSAGENGPIIVDDLEKLDPENLILFEKIASKTPYQFIFTRVGSGPLTVKTHD